MRLVIIGAGNITIRMAEILINQGHDVIIIEKEEEKIESLRESLDCSFLMGDGSRPGILKEVDPKSTDVLVALTDDDQTNILASLVARSMEFDRTITAIYDPDLTAVCQELGLENIVIPSRLTGRHLADLALNPNMGDLSTIIKHNARFFSFEVEEKDAQTFNELSLPEDTRPVLFYRENKFQFPNEDTKLEPGDEVVLLTRGDNIGKLNERWPKKKKDQTEKLTLTQKGKNILSRIFRNAKEASE